MRIFLADLQNSYYRYIRNSVPIGMGFVAAYLKHRFGDAITIHQFRKFEEMHEAMQDYRPDMVAFGSYSWNTQLTLKTASYVRRIFPDALIAVGGPDVSQNLHITNKEILSNRQVDFYMPNEGEGPTANIIEAFLSLGDAKKVRGSVVEGCISVDPDFSQPVGSVITRFEDDINNIPSPYLGGMMDYFLDDIDYLPIIQTARGCPYRCTFCVSGKDTWSKVKAFDMDRVRDEIDYIEKRAKNRYMRFADENFGILHRDVEIAEYLMDTRQRTGFPHSVSIYTDKHPTERVKHISNMLRDMMPFNISYQSATHDVLQNIKRINLKDGVVSSAIGYARENDLTLVSELIFALPGESLDSYLSSIDKLLDFRFESIAMNQLRVLKGSEMDDPADRAKYGVRTMFSMSENGYTQHPDMENIEIDEWVIENNTMTEEEYFLGNRLIALFDFAHFRSYLKELLFLFECHGVRSTEILLDIAKTEDKAPILHKMSVEFETGMREFLHDTPEEVVEYVRRKMAADEPLMGIYVLEDKLIIGLFENGHFEACVDEAIATGLEILRERNGGEVPADFLAELAVVRQIVLDSFIPADTPVDETLLIESPFDIMAWIAGNYADKLTDLKLEKPVDFALNIRGIDAYRALWNRDESVNDKYQRAFAVVTSANRRRGIAYAPGQGDKAALYGASYGFRQDQQVEKPDLTAAAGE
ncbi:hypothetical protein GH722_04590 [Alphaproteobacteria bacterium HT1-32]|jgi:radical SAM superfamily enzyme YgiQ (UPF0313 family)|nr:hypothetical protein [Alphaproteobacteria bacterium HT1-32]